MVKGRNRFGISLHSRKRLWDFQRRAEERHSLISLSSIGVFPAQTGKYEVAGALLGEGLEVPKGINTSGSRTS